MPTMIGSSSSANDLIHPRTDTAPSTPLTVSIRLRIPRWASRWFIGMLACPKGRATAVRYRRYPGLTHSRHSGTMSKANRVVCS